MFDVPNETDDWRGRWIGETGCVKLFTYVVDNPIRSRRKIGSCEIVTR